MICFEIWLSQVICNFKNRDYQYHLLTYHSVSQRGVVFFRKQDDITNDLQKELVQRLGEISGKPKTSKLAGEPRIIARGAQIANIILAHSSCVQLRS